jgi:hypothetical protein
MISDKDVITKGPVETPGGERWIAGNGDILTRAQYQEQSIKIVGYSVDPAYMWYVTLGNRPVPNKYLKEFSSEL